MTFQRKQDIRTSTFRPTLEHLEARRVLSAGFRTSDGSGNNLAHVAWGQAGELLTRIAPVSYADGVSAPNGAGRPGAREISNAIISETEELLNDRSLSDFIYVFGQMIDHDLDLTINASPAEAFNIPVPVGDPFFDPNAAGNRVIGMNRSKSDPASDTDAENPGQQVNEVTAWLDASVIYDSSESRARALRTLSGGQLKISASNMLPFNTMGLDNQTPFGTDSTTFFVAGDRRVNENIELTAIQTV